ncbi:unnamed protein product, partial [Ectocarpus sp. 13 AM-2016]
GNIDVDGGQVGGVSGGSHALVTFSKAEDASTAVNWLNGAIDMDGNEIQIKWALHQDQHVGYYGRCSKVSNVPPEIDWLGVNNHFRRAADHVCLKRWCGEAILRFETREERDDAVDRHNESRMNENQIQVLPIASLGATSDGADFRG